MTLDEFGQIFALLATQLRATDADLGTIEGYYKGMKDLDVELVTMAAINMGRQGGSAEGDNRHWFPKTSEWRAATAKVEADRARQLNQIIHARLHRGEPPLCADCDDTGWRMDDHEHVTRCECRKQRRLEILGRRPMPALPEPRDPEASQQARVEALVQQTVRPL